MPTTDELDRQIQCVQREIAKRRQVYARLVAGGRMAQEMADREIQLMCDVGDSLLKLRKLCERGDVS